MMPSAMELTYFLEIAATENISRASERLGISQPALSLALKRLEHHVGSELIVRYKTGVKLTKTGRRFQARARALLEYWQEVLKSVKRDELEIAGCYSIGAHVSVACNQLAQVLPSLLTRYPSLEFQLHHDLSRKITEKVINFELDFGVVVNPISHPDLVIRSLYKDEVGFYAAADAQQGIELELLYYDPDLIQGRWLLKQVREAGMSFQRSLVSSSLETLTALCAMGYGVAILPKRVAEAANKPLVRVLKHVPAYVDLHALVYRADVHSTVAAKALARRLETELQTT